MNDKCDPKIILICHLLIYYKNRRMSPLLFGLGVAVYNEFGSKSLINLMNGYGLMSNYDTICKFMSFAAQEQMLQTENYFVPKSLANVDINNPITIIDAAIDNFDRNEETIDGKNTTHILAMVLYQRCQANKSFEYDPKKFHQNHSI